MAPRPVPEAARHILDLLEPLGPVECRRFFSGWAFRLHGVQFATLLRDTLYLSVDGTLRESLRAAGGTPFRYRKGERWITVERFYSLPESALDDADILLDWCRCALEAGGRE